MTALNGTPEAPQAVIVARHISADSMPYRYGAFDVLGRFLGEAELRRWEDRGFPIALPGGREVVGSSNLEREITSMDGSD